jgi:hypothetical protein
MDVPYPRLRGGGYHLVAGTASKPCYEWAHGTGVLFAGGHPSTAHCIVFPRNAVWIQHDGGARFVADASIATIYNQGQSYRRWAISADGDRCDWIAFDVDVVRDVIAAVSPPDSEAVWPFRFEWAPVDSRFYAAQRQLFQALDARDQHDPMSTDEHPSP